MIIVLEPSPGRRAEYYRILEELAEVCMVAMSLAELEIWLMDPSKQVDLVIADPEIEVDGVSVVVSELVKQLRPEAGFLAATDVTQFDMTDEKIIRCKLGVKIALTNRLVRAIAARVCHEVNNPASACLGNAELILESSEVKNCSEPLRQGLNVIVQQCQRIGEVTRWLACLTTDNLTIEAHSGVPMVALPELPPEPPKNQ